MMTAVIWLRSIRATGISAFSGPGARTSAWKMRSVSSWRRTSVVRSIIAIVRSVVCSRRWSFSIGRPPASESALTTDDAHTPTGSSSVIIEVAVSRSARVAAKCSRIACAGEPVTTRSLTWRSMIWPRSLTSVAMLSMIAVAAKSWPPLPTCVSSNSRRLGLRVARRTAGLRTAMSACLLLVRGRGCSSARSLEAGRLGLALGYVWLQRRAARAGRWPAAPTLRCIREPATSGAPAQLRCTLPLPTMLTPGTAGRCA